MSIASIMDVDLTLVRGSADVARPVPETASVPGLANRQPDLGVGRDPGGPSRR